MNALPNLTSLVESLAGLDSSEISLEVVSDLMARVEIPDSEQRRFVQFADSHYLRHKIFRNDCFDVMFLCWKPGQVTRIHNHNGQMGWVRVLRGRLEEVGYKTPSGDPDVDLRQIEIDDDMVGHGIELQECHRQVVPASKAIATVDRVRNIHSLGNPLEHAQDEPAVSLHVYSRPHESCLTIDPETRTCRRKVLVYDSEPDWRADPIGC